MTRNYSGSSINDLYKGKDQWSFYVPPLTPSKHHSILFEFPVTVGSTPRPHIQRQPKHWDENHVRMPFSPENVYPAEGDEAQGVLVSRWELMCKELKKPIESFSDFEKAIISYNRSVSKLPALKFFFEEVLTEEDNEEFFVNILPKIIDLALRLPEIVPGSIPLLKKHHSRSVSFSQLQISSLLANAFLCTFPWKKDVSFTYPGVNFIRLYMSSQRRRDCVIEKIKCIMHYFRRITRTEPKGVVTFERKFLYRKEAPRWDALQNNLGNTKVHITHNGTIEDDGLGFLQIDFANKYVGGGVLGYGCVQEEIRFVICPELLIGRLFIEQLDDTEAVIVRGVERFSKYTGYGDSFKWDGNYVDSTPFDDYCRKQTTISIIDATFFGKADRQYNPSAILRELNKAYVGFSCHHTDNLSPVATGNWGCGAFNGDVRLKMLIQLIACNAAHRDFVYYTFGDKELEETLYNMYLFIATNGIKTAELWRIFCKFAASGLPVDQFYSFIQQSWFDIKDSNSPNSKQPEKIENSSKNKSSPPKTPLHRFKKDNENTQTPTTSKTPSEKTPTMYKQLNVSTTPSNSIKTNKTDLSSSSSDVGSPRKFSRVPTNPRKEKTKFDKELFKKNHNELLDIFSTIDGPPIGSKNKEENSDTLLTASEKWKKGEKKVKDVVIDIEENAMEVDESPQDVEAVKSKIKITDYFSKLS